MHNCIFYAYREPGAGNAASANVLRLCGTCVTLYSGSPCLICDTFDNLHTRIIRRIRMKTWDTRDTLCSGVGCLPGADFQPPERLGITRQKRKKKNPCDHALGFFSLLDYCLISDRSGHFRHSDFAQNLPIILISVVRAGKEPHAILVSIDGIISLLCMSVSVGKIILLTCKDLQEFCELGGHGRDSVGVYALSVTLLSDHVNGNLRAFGLTR